MNNKDLFDNTSNQLLISYELLRLMQWIAENEPETLKRLINKALKNGLDTELNQNQYLLDEHNTAIEAQESLIDFMGLLEALLFESITEHAVNKVLQKNIMPAIDQIDTTTCDDAIVKFSVEKASSKLNNSRENPQELLFKELLKRWKPSKKKTIN